MKKISPIAHTESPFKKGSTGDSNNGGGGQTVQPEKLYYIQNEGFCGNALFWWGKEHKGYVTDIRQAGKYTATQAKAITQRPEDHAYEVEYIDGLLEAQKLIIDSQYVDMRKIVKL